LKSQLVYFRIFLAVCNLFCCGTWNNYQCYCFIIDEEDKDVLQLFFDDNIDGTDESIVDARSLNTGKPLSRKEALEKHLVIVDTFKAISDPDYFLSLIKERSTF